MALPSARDLLEAQMRHAWAGSAWVLEGVTDDEWFWEPAPGAWSVRPRAEVSNGYGTGEWQCEDTWPPPDPLPVTTIAWRATHLAAWNDVYINHTFGDASHGLWAVDVPGTCEPTLAWLADSQARFLAAVEALTDEEVFEPRPAHWGQQVPIVHLVTSMIHENVHHIAEIGVLRDMHRGQARNQPPPPPTNGPEWWG